MATTVPEALLGAVEQRLLRLLTTTSIRKVERLRDPVLMDPQKDTVHFFIDGETNSQDAECIHSAYDLTVFVGFTRRGEAMKHGWQLAALVVNELLDYGRDLTLGGMAISIQESRKDVLPTQLSDPEYIAEMSFLITVAREEGVFYA